MRGATVLSILVVGLVSLGGISCEQRLNLRLPMFWNKKDPPLPERANDTSLINAQGDLFIQLQDHFGSTTRTFYNLYFFNKQFEVNDNPPILLMLGGEASITRAFLLGGHMYEIARDIGACMILLETRGYGSPDYNFPHIGDRSPLITVDQSLADVADFLSWWKSNETYAESKVIVFGGSFAGNLAAWMKISYPDLIHAAVASSAPVLAKSNFFEHLEVINEAIVTEGSPEYVNVIREGIADAGELLRTDEGAIQLATLFGLCEPVNITNPLDIQVFFSFIIQSFTELVQYARPGEIALECMDLGDESLGSPLQRLAAHIKREAESTDCYSTYYTETVEYYKPEEFMSEEKSKMRTWLWQMCSEYGYFPTTDSENQPFDHVLPLSFYEDHLCPDMFGGISSAELHASIDGINEKYGGQNPKAERVIFVHGSIDPWSKLGVVEDLSEDLPAVFIPGASRSEDLLSTSTIDSSQLTAARKVIRDTVLKWIAES